ncbi:hypothetical protein C8Q80DRAFT_1273876 [Daedaleopsis nitida]|nr:hypothetical protein C8Q80DRAFT_1273876 [Daedaleopsis nitida]
MCERMLASLSNLLVLTTNLREFSFESHCHLAEHFDTLPTSSAVKIDIRFVEYGVTVVFQLGQSSATATATCSYSISAFFIGTLTTTSINAHGYVQDVVVGSKHYTIPETHVALIVDWVLLGFRTVQSAPDIVPLVPTGSMRCSGYTNGDRESGKTADGKWAATDSIYTFTIPPKLKLKADQYIVRHEMCAAPVFFFCVPSRPC